MSHEQKDMTMADIIKITVILVVVYLAGGVLLAGTYSFTSPVIFKKTLEEKKAALKEMIPGASESKELYIRFKEGVTKEQAETIISQKGARSIGFDEASGRYLVEFQEPKFDMTKTVEALGLTPEISNAAAYYNVGEQHHWEAAHHHAGYYEAMKGSEFLGYIAETYGKGYSSYINVLVGTDKDFVIQKIKIISHAETPGLGDEVEKAYFKDQFKGKTLEQLEVVKQEPTEKILAITGATISSRAVTAGVRDAVKMLKEKYSGADASAPKEGTPHE